MEFKIIRYDIIDSTNEECHRLAGKGYSQGTVVIAEEQTHGRGRFKRRWFSPKGSNIYLSILLRPSVSLEKASTLTLLSGVAVAAAIRDFSGLIVNLKWPNDIIFNEKKLGGILLESHLEKGILQYAVAGIGVNVNMMIEDMPDEIRDFATSLRIELGNTLSKEDLIDNILMEFFRFYEEWLIDDKSIVNSWRALTTTLYRRVRCILPDGKELVGYAEDIDRHGVLIIRSEKGETVRINAGDVIHCSD